MLQGMPVQVDRFRIVFAQPQVLPGQQGPAAANARQAFLYPFPARTVIPYIEDSFIPDADEHVRIFDGHEKDRLSLCRIAECLRDRQGSSIRRKAEQPRSGTGIDAPVRRFRHFRQ